MQPADPVGGAWLRDGAQGTQAMLVRVGGCFMYARDRSVRLPPRTTLAACLAGAPTLAAAHALIDCEISLGRIGKQGWRIDRSTLPHRIGDSLNPRRERDLLHMTDRALDGRGTARTWEIAESEGAAGALDP